MTSEWIYDEKSQEAPKVYDKDFKRLNKIATASKVTTCLDQYQMRKKLDSHIRIRGPGESAMRKSYMVSTVDVREIDSAFGRPNRPSTPMKSVMSHQFENEASED